ncbi:MAG TPA: hypothetical protein VME18_03260 [Acidobacteriaceae bacterium]|nr:hypothetical protein [Acidobacteriaceae bacterium]
MLEMESAAGQSLLGVLKRTLPAHAAEHELSAFGGTVRIKSVAGPNQRSCVTTCSLHLNELSPQSPGFLTCFEESGKRIAWGKSNSESQTAAATRAWLQGAAPEALYGDFDFIDREKRRLARIQEEALRAVPSLAAGTNPQLKEFREWSALWFRRDARAVMVDGTSLNAFFSWDQTNLFHWPVHDAPTLAVLVLKWVCENRAPSAMRADFPWLSIGRLADFYERGNPVEGDFLESWDEVECWLTKTELVFPQHDAALRLLKALRKASYDCRLRAGIDHGPGLLLSRSRRSGLSPRMPYVRFSFGGQPGLMDMSTNLEGVEERRGVPISLSRELAAAVERLSEFPVTESVS